MLFLRANTFTLNENQGFYLTQKTEASGFYTIAIKKHFKNQMRYLHDIWEDISWELVGTREVELGWNSKGFIAIKGVNTEKQNTKTSTKLVGILNYMRENILKSEPSPHI